jgi:hypothetical protein
MILFLAVGLMACGGDNPEATDQESATMEEASSPNTLTQAERDEGWILLFDGQSMDEWTGLGRDQIPEGHWVVEDGTIRKIQSGDVPAAADGQPLEGGDIMTKDTFRDFEFAFEWRISEGGNSGIKYNVSEELSTQHEPVYAALGFEYQILDDDEHPDSEDPTHRAGGLYDMIPPNDNKQLKPVGEWNQARIVLNGSHGEHWLNGEKVLEFDMDTARFDSLLAASKYADIEGFADRRAGRIVLQDHTDDAWFRNLKVRRLDGDQVAQR